MTTLMRFSGVRLFALALLIDLLAVLVLIALCTAATRYNSVPVLDLVAEAPNAIWSNRAGRLLFDADEEAVRENPKGFVTYRTDVILEDDRYYPQVLETHPRWDTHNADRGFPGMIRGEYYVPNVTAGQHFTALVGFIMPVGAPNTNGVEIRILFDDTLIYHHTKQYTEELLRIDADLPVHARVPGILTIEVHTNGDSTQDWLSWVEAEVISLGIDPAGTHRR